VSERDELATIIHDATFPDAYREDRMAWPAWVFLAADRAFAAGYRKENP